MVIKKKIIILTYYHFPCYHPVLESLFAKELARNHEITWLFQGDISKGRNLRWHKSKVMLIRKTKKHGGFAQVVNKILGLQIFVVLIKLLLQRDVKIVLIRDRSIMALLVAPLRALFGFKLYFQYSAPQGDISIEYSKSNKSIKRLWYFFAGFSFNALITSVIRIADIVFPITEFHRMELVKYKSPEKLIPITMGVDEEWINRRGEEIFYLKEIKKTDFLLIYFGSLSFVRNPYFVLKTFSKVMAKCPNCKLILIGKTAASREANELKFICNSLGIKKNVIFTGLVHRNKLQDYLSYSDLSISAIPPAGHYKISSPTKIYESLGNGVPVVANKGIYEQEKVILESEGGMIVDYDTTAFCKAIISLLKDRELREDMSKKGREYVTNHYSYNNIAKKISPYFI
jgi:glycosyltransferase involved in cell wall biosynthesis